LVGAGKAAANAGTSWDATDTRMCASAHVDRSGH